MQKENDDYIELMEENEANLKISQETDTNDLININKTVRKNVEFIE